jgi:endonuclease/exonuclease/phosphatase (EEP) superfamily protein YafD
VKTRSLIIILLSTLIIACDYIPVRTPFTINNESYSRQSLDSDSIRIMTWNIHKEGNTSKWQDEFAQLVNSKGPDLILLQEVRLEEEVGHFLRQELDHGWEFSPNVFQSNLDAYSGLLTAANAKPILVYPALTSGREPLTNTAKPTLFTHYRLGGFSKELLVVNIHAINFQLDIRHFREQLDLITEEVKKHTGPVIVAGDFNTWNQERLVLLTDAVREMNLEGIDFGADKIHIETTFGRQLDFIFYSKDKLKVVEDSEDVIEEIESSDHRALFVELTLI